MLNESYILKCSIIINSIFWVQFCPPGSSIVIDLHYYHIMLYFCEMNSVSEGIFFGFAFWKVSFLSSVSGKVFFGSFENAQMREQELH